MREAEAAIARQEPYLDYAGINAPFGGRSSLSLGKIGDMVVENQTNLVPVDPIDLQMASSLEDVERVRQAMRSGDVSAIAGEDAPGEARP